MAKKTLQSFQGEGEVCALLRAHDWSGSPLGSPDNWPPALCTAVGMVLSTSFPMFVAWGPQLGFLYNDAYVRILGDKHPAALGAPFERIWSEIWPDLAPIIGNALAGHSSYFEDLPLTVLRRGFPEQSRFTFSFSPLAEADGRIGGMFCTVIETTDRVLAERRAAFALAVSDALRTLTSPAEVVAAASALLGRQLDLARAVFAEVDETGGMVFIPRDWVSGEQASLAGRWFSLEDDFGPQLTRALRAGEVVRVGDCEGDPLTAAVNSSLAAKGVRAVLIVPLVKAGRLIALLGLQKSVPYVWQDSDQQLAHDTAERIWSAVESVRAQAQLKEADQRKDEFLAMLAHELRNPLAPISAAADLLRIGKLDEARVRHASSIIGRQVRHMTTLVDDLLDVSRVTRGLVQLAKGPVDARGIVEEAVEQAKPLMQARHQNLTLYLPDEVVTVLGDKARLVQVMVNLLNNASKYSPEGRSIEARAAVDGDELVLEVRDDGIGMEPKLTARVFELFAQAQRSSDRSQGGLGLGLALVRHLVELHGGSVSCSSPGLGMGSSFMVRLPMMRAPGVGRAPSGAGMPRVAARLNLMVVDDNVDAANTLAMLLRACGHEVQVEHSSVRALEVARAAPPDACLLDIGLPEIDGNELARRLQGDPRTAGIVLVAVTGYGQEHDREAAFAAGFRDHLVKPVDIDKLAAVLAGVRPHA